MEEGKDFEIVEKTIQGGNVMRLTLQSPEAFNNADPSVIIRIYNDRGESRPYTPLWMTPRRIYQAIKIYENGALSSYLAGLSVGDRVKVSGFENKRKFVINEHRNILMVCGGTGITPMFQILNYAMSQKECTSSFMLLFYNTRRENIFLSEELEALQNHNTGPHLEVKHIITSEPRLAEGTGVLRADVAGPIVEVCMENSYDYVYVCGTDGFLETVCGPKTRDKKQGELAGALKELGFTAEAVYKF